MHVSWLFHAICWSGVNGKEGITYSDRDLQGGKAGVNAAVVVQVIPLPRREVCWHGIGALQQDGSHHQGIPQHPLRGDEQGCCVGWPAEEDWAHH